MTSSSHSKVAHRWLTAAEYDSSHPETEKWVRGFLSRHPKIKPFLKDKVYFVTNPNQHRHPEASFTSRGIELFPKFWALSGDVQDFVFAHEIGHSVESRLSRSLPTLAEPLGVDVWDNLPFAQFNMGEAFADSFASYFLDGEVQRRYPGWASLVEAAVRPGRVAARMIYLDRAEVNKTVDNIIQRFKVLARGKMRQPLGKNPQALMTLEMPVMSVDGEVHRVLVALTSTVARTADWVLGGGMGLLTRGPHTGRRILVLELNGKYPFENFTDPEIIADPIRAVLMHELTHAADFESDRQKPAEIQGRIPSDGEVDLKTYFNNPREVRAYMRELYEEIHPRVIKMMSVPHMRETWGFAKILLLALKPQYRWTRMEPHLTRANKNRILKGLTTAFEDDGLFTGEG
jgi:hypothetical protein